MKITVCALTYKRPVGLSRLLDGLAELEVHSEWDELTFVIVDNCPDASAKEYCESFDQAEKLAGPLQYVHQPIQGIARSRNAALDAAASSDWTAFIDDDERPDPTWLVCLYDSALKHGADVVGGPVTPVIEGQPPAWLHDGGFFERRKYADGQELGHVFTNNVLFKTDKPKELAVRFDERPEFAALRVGEDRLFFQTLAMRGAKTVYCADAMVKEWIPADRANESWLVARMLKIGEATSAVELNIVPGFKTRFVLMTKALVWIALGALKFLALGFTHPIRRTRARRAMSYGRGLLKGL